MYSPENRVDGPLQHRLHLRFPSCSCPRRPVFVYMESDQHVSDASKETTNAGENSFPGRGVDVLSTDNEVKSHENPVAANPQHGNHLYRQDVVKRNDGSMGGNRGGTGDGAGSGDDNAGGGNNKRRPLITDQVRVLWTDDSETTHHRNELTVVDRGFLHGDYVASALDPTGQVGLVVDVNISVDLRAPDGSAVKDISSRDLKRVRDITVGDYVVCGPWLGRVDDVLDNVTVLFDDGSVCKVTRAEPLQLRPITKNLLEDGHCPYHPGQRVRSSSSSVFKSARWLTGAWKVSRLEGTVIKVTVGSVYVHWIASAGYGPESSVSPAEEQNPKNLKVLSCFTHANWQLGDWCLLPSLALSSTIPLNKGFSKLRLQESDSSHLECDADEAMPDESNGPVESMHLDVGHLPEAVEGNSQNNLSPKSSSCGSSVSVTKDTVHESWHIHRKKLRKVVVKRDKKVRRKEENYEKALLIVNTRTTVDVLWQDGTVEQGLKSTLLVPIESPGDHDFVAEQYVVEKAADDSVGTSELRRVGVVKSVNAKEKTACVRWLKQVARPEDPREFEKEEIVSVYELEGHPDYDYCYGDVVVRLSPVSVAVEGACSDSAGGHKLLDGSYDVRQEAIRDGDDEGGNTASEEACNEFSDLSWVGNITGLRNGDIEVTWADGMISTVGPQAVYVVGRDDDESIVAGSDVSDDAASWETVEDDEMDALNNEEKEPSAEGTNTNHEAAEDNVVEEQSSGMNGPLAFPLAAIGFVTRLASGIFSRGRSHGDSFGSNSSGENEMQSEEDIHVSDGRDSSDMSNPQDPSVVDIVDGVTKPVKGEEPAVVASENSLDAPEASCNPRRKKSDSALCCDDNICSFKRFDTAKDPLDHFFLGATLPSNGGRKWLKKVQRDWNILQNNLPDGIYVRVYEDRMDLLRAVIVGAYGTPYQDGLFFFDFHLPPEYPDVPPDFEDLVKEHFRQHGYYILKACDAYMKGYLIGSLSRDASVTDKSEANATSVGFKLMLAKIVPKLITALSEVGADCQEFKHLQQS
ncbi:hypothetical protein Cgig2_014728 [Carnegiea gigantea]|uniref:UBC core domain-containing protein n=1 Tax=Carnegiea gigantea TaxID=171969 RepID=A0A9Q1L1J9_9CARY|nr:hypothetical protein Cgig2_014728 [Carnegiea gigantea]